MKARAPVATGIILLMLTSSLAGCFNTGESSPDYDLELEIDFTDAAKATYKRGEMHIFELEGTGTLTVPPTILLIINGSVVTSGTITLENAEINGHILIPPTTHSATIQIDDRYVEIETQEGNPIVSGVEWYERMEFITSICSDSTQCGAYVNRWMGTPNPAFERAASYFAGHFTGLGYETHILRVNDHLNPTQPESLNVIAWKRGRNVSCVQGMGAHMDIAPPGGPPGGGTYEGAYDNTAGTVSMMLFAKALVNMEVECDTFLALWSSEEEGLRGSNAFANNQCSYCLPHDKELKFYINMDMMGISWPAHKSNGDAFPYHAWSGPDDDPNEIEMEITHVMEYVHWDVLEAPRNLSINGSYGAGCDQHWDAHQSNVFDVHEDTFGRSDHVTFRNRGAQTIFHLGAYDDDYSAYHSPSDTLDNMVEVVGGVEELQKSIEFVMWAAYLEFIIADQTPSIRNVNA